MRSKQCSKHTNAELMPRQTSGLWKTMHAQFHMLPVAPLNHPITQRQSEGCTKYHSNQRQSQDCTKYRSNWRQLEGCTKYRHNWLRCTGAVVNAPVSSVQSGFNVHREYTVFQTTSSAVTERLHDASRHKLLKITQGHSKWRPWEGRKSVSFPL